MTTLTCPKCRQGLSDDALDLGQCPLCGFPLDGPVVLGAPARRSGATRRLLALGLLAVLAGAGVAGYAFLGRANPEAKEELVNRGDAAEANVPTTPVRYAAPMPHEVKRPDAGATVPSPTNPPTGPPSAKGPPPVPLQPMPPGPGKVEMPGQLPQPIPPVAVEPPKRVGPRPVATVMKVNPKVEPKRHFDHPDDIADVVDLNTGDLVVLTGRVRILRVHFVNGKAVLDASGLVAEEVEIRGDLNNEAQVTVNAPLGKVQVSSFVMGNAKLTITAPGGLVVFGDGKMGRFTGGSTTTVTAKRLEARCPLSGGAKVNVTLTAGGSLRLTKCEDGARVTYKKAAANDPEPVTEKGVCTGGATIVPAK